MTATFTSVSRNDGRAARLAVEDRELAEVRARADPVELDPVLVHDGFALEDDEQRVAGLTLADQVDTRRKLRDLRVPGDRSALPRRALREQAGRRPAPRPALASIPTVASPCVRPRRPALLSGAVALSHLEAHGVDGQTGRNCVRRLAIFVIRRRWWVIAFGADRRPARRGCTAAGVHDKLSTGGFDDPGVGVEPGRDGDRPRFPSVGPVGLRHRRHREERARSTAPRSRPPALRLTKRPGPREGCRDRVVVLDARTRAAAPQPRLPPGADRRIAARDATTRSSRPPSDLAPSSRPTDAVVQTAVTGRAEVTRQLADQADKDLKKVRPSHRPAHVRRAGDRVRRPRRRRRSR